MKKHCIALLCLVAVTTAVKAQTPLVGTGSSYTSIFNTPTTVTYDLPNPPGLAGIAVLNGTATGSAGIWDLSAQGGANASLLGLGLLESGAQTELTATSLKFNVNNDNNTLLGLLGVGASVHYRWQATAYFDTPGSVLGFADQTTYNISFFVDGNDGLLGSIAGLNPSFSFELIDGSGNALASQSSGTLINIAGLLGTGVETGTVNVNYTVSGTVPTGPLGIRFTGDATVGATALGAGTEFATISDVNITATPIPEPAGLMLITLAGMAATLVRHRRALP